MFPGTGTLRGSTRAFGPQAGPETATLATEFEGTRTGYIQATRTKPEGGVSGVLGLESDDCWSRVLNWGSCASTLVPRSPGIFCPCLVVAGVSLRTSTPHLGTFTPSTSTVSSRYPRYGISSPFAARRVSICPSLMRPQVALSFFL